MKAQPVPGFRSNFLVFSSALAGALGLWGCETHGSWQPAPGEQAANVRLDPQAAAAVKRATPNRSKNAERRGVSAAPKSSCPPGMQRVDEFCIDRHEAHLVELGAGGKPASEGKQHSAYQRPRHGVRYAARSAASVVPQGYMSRIEAADACRNAGKRLCGANEWHRACTGSQHTAFPYGASEERGRCNTGKGHVMTKLFGMRTRLTYDLHYNNPRLNQEPGFLARTGAFASCTNDYELYDMVGNLHEWVADDVDNKLRKKIPIAYGDHLMGAKGNGVFMGGYFSSNGEHGRGCAYATTAHFPDYHDYSIGFRCCAEPE